MHFNPEFGLRLFSEEDVGFGSIITMHTILLNLHQILHQRHPSPSQKPLWGKSHHYSKYVTDY